MKRIQIKKLFGTNGPAILPVIHVLNKEQIKANVDIALEAGCPGFFLINHDFPYNQLLPLICFARETFPTEWMGVNFLGVSGKEAFPILAALNLEGINVDAYWADNARINENVSIKNQKEANEIVSVRQSSNWEGLYFGGTAFKKQREVDPKDYAAAASLACHFMDVVTTSGIATGEAADILKIEVFREACKDNSIALASGVTVDNIHIYAPLIDAFLVSTGINFQDDFYNINAAVLKKLMDKLR